MTYRSLQRANAYFYDLERRAATVRRHGAIRYLSSGVNHLAAPRVLREIAAEEMRARAFLANYTAPGGALPVVAAVMMETQARLGPEARGLVRPANICLTVGATGALATGFRYLARHAPRRTALVLGLNYSFFSTICDENRIAYEILVSQDPHRILPTAAEAVARIAALQPGIVVLTQPTNPSGELYDAADLGLVVAAVADCGGWLVFDEVPNLALPGEPDLPTPVIDAKAGRFPERLLWINSFSKSRSLAGLRIGYLVAPEEVAAHVRLENERQLWSPVNVGTAALVCDLVLRGLCRGTPPRQYGRLLKLLAPYGDDFSRFDSVWRFIDGCTDWTAAGTSYRADLAETARTCEDNFALFRNALAPFLEMEIPAASGFNHCVRFAQDRGEWDFVRDVFDAAGIDFYTETVFADHDDATQKRFWVRVSCAIDRVVFAEGVERLAGYFAR